MSKTLEWLERFQISAYLFAIFAAVLVGILFPQLGSSTEILIEPLLMVLLYQTFLGVPFQDIKQSLKDRGFLVRLLLGNFILVPAVVWILVNTFLSDAHPAIVIGFIVVLVCPCIDYVLVFSDIAGGDTPKFTASTPILMAVQILLLPVYLWAFTDDGALEGFSLAPFARAFILLILIPLALAWLTQQQAEKHQEATSSDKQPPAGSKVASWSLKNVPAFMVPVMMATLFVVICSYIDQVQANIGSLLQVAALYLLYVVLVVALMIPITRSLAKPQRVSLVFSVATRNSLVVLPLIMALPDEYDLAVPTVLTQTFVELACMVVLMSLLPKLLRNSPEQGSATAQL